MKNSSLTKISSLFWVLIISDAYTSAKFYTYFLFPLPSAFVLLSSIKVTRQVLTLSLFYVTVVERRTDAKMTDGCILWSKTAIDVTLATIKTATVTVAFVFPLLLWNPVGVSVMRWILRELALRRVFQFESLCIRLLLRFANYSNSFLPCNFEIMMHRFILIYKLWNN